jgi:DNA-binding NarL/FixJ family response regulator
MAVCRSLLIVAPPDPFRDSLRVLLQAEARIMHVTLADSIVEGCRAIKQQLPDRVIIDSNLPDSELWSFCTLLKTLAPPPQCVVIIHNHEQRAAAQARALPALLAGFRSESLFDMIFSE